MPPTRLRGGQLRVTELVQSYEVQDRPKTDSRKPKNSPDHPSQHYFLVVLDLGLYSALSSLMRPKAVVSPESRALDLCFKAE